MESVNATKKLNSKDFSTLVLKYESSIVSKDGRRVSHSSNLKTGGLDFLQFRYFLAFPQTIILLRCDRSLVVTRGHSWSLVCSFGQDPKNPTVIE